MDILQDLTPAQRDAVTHVDGPLLVLAGAGSGKTRVITRRIAYLLTRDIPPWQVLAITFTNKAAGEMRERTHALVPEARRPLVSTFHSFCARMLREYGEVLGLDPGFTIYDRGNQEAAAKQAIGRLGLDATHFSPPKFLATISRAKNRLQRAADYAARHNSDFTGRRAAAIYEAYEAILREARALDFDDLLLEVAQALQAGGEFRDLLVDRFRYLLIDEYQDTNHAQYVIARELAGTRRNLCATGDPDQSIYGWRGAELQNILDFEKDFPDARVVLLERNYRSTKTILAAASAVIAHNHSRKPKDLHTENPAGTPVTIVQTDDEEAEAASIARRIQAAHGEGLAFRDQAVFVRTAAQMRALEDAFRRARPPVPYEVIRGASFYDRREVRDVLAYLQVLHNPADRINTLRVINTPPRGIGKKTVEALEAYAEAEGLALVEATRYVADIPDLPARGRAALNRFGQLMAALREVPADPVAPLVEAVMEESGYAESLKGGDEAASRLENLDELVSLAASYDEQAAAAADPAVIKPGLEGFLETVNLSSDQDAYDEEADRVPLMTLHAAKGLEFPAVTIAGCERGLLPHINSMETMDELEEERRLFFVGMTRAKKHLTLTYADYRRLRGRMDRCVPSRFLGEIPEAAARVENERSGTTPAVFSTGQAGYRQPGAHRVVKHKTDPATGLAVGERVRHPTYGTGHVLRFQTSGGRRMVRVRFGTVGEKLLDPRYARLERVASA